MSEICDWDDLVEQYRGIFGNFYYKKFTKVPFTGKVTGKEQGELKDGKKEGKWVYYNEEENIIDEDIWKDGECVEMCEGDE